MAETAETQKREPGRPRRFGTRHPIITRIPQDVADVVMAEAKSRGLSYSEYIATILAMAHGDDRAAMPERKSPRPPRTVQDSLFLDEELVRSLAS